MIRVPFMKMPRCCDECPFGMCKSSLPLSTGEHTYQCNVDFWENGKYTRERKAPFDEHVVPVQCPLIEENIPCTETLLQDAKADEEGASE